MVIIGNHNYRFHAVRQNSKYILDKQLELCVSEHYTLEEWPANSVYRSWPNKTPITVLLLYLL